MKEKLTDTQAEILKELHRMSTMAQTHKLKFSFQTIADNLNRHKSSVWTHLNRLAGKGYVNGDLTKVTKKGEKYLQG